MVVTPEYDCADYPDYEAQAAELRQTLNKLTTKLAAAEALQELATNRMLLLWWICDAIDNDGITDDQRFDKIRGMLEEHREWTRATSDDEVNLTDGHREKLAAAEALATVAHRAVAFLNNQGALREELIAALRQYREATR